MVRVDAPPRPVHLKSRRDCRAAHVQNQLPPAATPQVLRQKLRVQLPQSLHVLVLKPLEPRVHRAGDGSFARPANRASIGSENLLAQVPDPSGADQHQPRSGRSTDTTGPVIV